MRRTLILIAAAALVGCGSRYENFEPATAVASATTAGHPAAQYTLANQGSARIWTGGAYRAELNDTTHTIVHLGVELTNESAQNLLLERVLLNSHTRDGAVVQNVPPSEVRGIAHLAPGQSSYIELYFALPEQIEPEELQSFDVRWWTRTDEGVVSESTSFVRSSRKLPREDSFSKPYWPNNYLVRQGGG